MAKFYMHPSSDRRSTQTARANLTAYNVGDKRKSATATDKFILECTTAGTSGAAAPAYTPVYNNTVNDGTVVWTYKNTGVFDVTNPDKAALNCLDALSSTYTTLASGDIVIALTNGSTEYTYSASCTQASVSVVKYVVRGYDNAKTNNYAIFNCSGSVQQTIGGQCVMFRWHWKNCSTSPVTFTADCTRIVCCKFTNNSGYGLLVGTGAEGSSVSSCVFESNTTGGVQMIDTASGGSIVGNYFAGNTGPAIVAGSALIYGNVIKASGGATGAGIYIGNAGNSSHCVISHNTIYVAAAFTANYGAIFYFANASASIVLVDNYIEGAVGSGAAAGNCRAYYLVNNNATTGAIAVMTNNYYYNCDGAVSSELSDANVGMYEAMSNTQISFGNTTSGDFEPTTDTSAAAYASKIGNETAWWGIGALPYIPSGGGGGGIFNPGFNGGFNG